MQKALVDGVASVPAAHAAELPALMQEALGELVGAARVGLLALSVGVGLGVIAELMEHEVSDVWAPRAGNGVRSVLAGERGRYSKGTRVFNVIAAALGRGLLTSEGERWQHQRRLIQPLFRAGRLRATRHSWPRRHRPRRRAGLPARRSRRRSTPTRR